MSRERRSTTESAEAYELFKRANELWGLTTIEANSKAKELSRQVIGLNPESFGGQTRVLCQCQR